MAILETANLISIDEYIEAETLSEVRHEYIGGLVYAMSGGSEAHNLICLNLATVLKRHLKGHPCRVFMADMKLRLQIAGDDIFYYPDLMVTCDPADNEKYYKTQPVVLVEVLSPTTERMDRREKFLSYQRLPSLKEYVLIDQEQMRVTLFQRATDWEPEHFAGDDTLPLPSIGFSIPVTEVYEDVLP